MWSVQRFLLLNWSVGQSWDPEEGKCENTLDSGRVVVFCPFSCLSFLPPSFFIPLLTWLDDTEPERPAVWNVFIISKTSCSQWVLYVWCLNSSCWEYLFTLTSSTFKTGRFHGDLLLMALISSSSLSLLSGTSDLSMTLSLVQMMSWKTDQASAGCWPTTPPR